MLEITPFLWFDTEAEDAARFYVSVFPRSRITGIVNRPPSAPSMSAAVLTVRFELDGKAFTALNGGPAHRFNEAVSFVVPCRTQSEIDQYWNRLVEDGGQHGPCGWLKDRFGLSWQIVPESIFEWLSGPGADRVMAAVRAMGKLEVATLRAAAAP